MYFTLIFNIINCINLIFNYKKIFIYSYLSIKLSISSIDFLKLFFAQFKFNIKTELFIFLFFEINSMYVCLVNSSKIAV